MSEYVLVFFYIGIFAIVAKHLQVKRTKLVDGIEVERYVWIYAFLAFLPVIIMTANRSWYIGDTFAYRRSFEQMPSAVSGLEEYMNNNNKDVGFYFASSLIKIFVTNNARVYFWIIACFQGLIIIWFFRNYSSSFFLSFFLFIASADYLSWMFNGIRQFTAVTIILLATPFILKKRYIPTILLILLASTIHQTALLMIPVIFIIQGEVWNKKTLLFVVAVLIVVLFVNQFTSFLDDSLNGTQYENVVSDIREFASEGTSVLRVAVYSIPAVLSFIYRKKINEEGTSIIKVSANMSIVSAGLYVFSMFSSGVFMGRLPIYCSLYGYLFLPWIIDKCFKDGVRIFVYSLLIILYLIYYYFQVSVTWNLF